ncbi:putative sporulation protein YyaC [Thermoanaerobacter thermohydrosulfuricus]|uniref:Putative sporulation protein YyaC n=2 Tax=Thermoanaerobacter thermohydrosulfuricus TaxID=1516 RepID=M8DP58_THETY|nr:MULTISPECIES: spore protease YyaC [Thermoanaerobacter]EMT38311.1 putative sporulation protein YyaC [Thermoanaerobacter thermohydrosulfuricus WC1]SDG31255.1 putative sporulation protein YyaC [Thermoanaerobacter thermohydrosulfuricus]SFE34257.1 putative sporulation protein YyaC [Thermoanaerobacter thermohydrosulfuricus]
MEELRLKYDDSNAIYFISNFLSTYLSPNSIFLCIGTDKFISDSLGPIVGDLLSKTISSNYFVYGTLKSPIHAMNLEENIKYIKKKHPNSKIIAIDASLGDKESIGKISIKKAPLYPGKGVGKMLPPVGDISIVGIVDVYDSIPLNSVRLGFVFDIAEVIAKSIQLALKY